MKKLIGLIIGLMISVSVFAKPSDDKIEKIIDNLYDRFGEIVEQCYDNDDGSNEYKRSQINIVLEMFDQETDDIIKSYSHGASYRFIALDNYISMEAEDNILEYEIEDIVGKSIQDFVYRNVTIAKTNMVFEDIYINNLDRYQGQSLISLF